MTIAKRLRCAAILAGLAIGAVSARAADEAAKNSDTVWIVKRTGGTIQMLPTTDEAVQSLLKKQNQSVLSKRSDATSTSEPKAPDAAAVTTGAEPRLLTQPDAARTVTVSQPRTQANVPLPIAPASERLASATATAYPGDETFPDRVSVSRPAPTNPNAVMEMDRVSSRVADSASANYDDYHTGRRMDGGGEKYQRPVPEPIAPGGQAHLSDGCPPGREFCPPQISYYDHHRQQCDCNECFNPCGGCGFFGGADYLYVRPTFSENTAYFRRNTSIDNSGNVTVTDTVVHQDFDYTSAPRVFLGYRFCDCGGEIRFTYWNYDNSSSQTTGAATTDTIYAGQLEINTSIPGQRLFVESNLNMNVYDIDYSKCVCYGGKKTCDGCDTCPVWTLKYSAGVRIADVRRTDDDVLLPVDALSIAGHISADFIGAGPRLGIEGRRYCRDGAFSLFAKGNLSLLLGEYDVKESRFTPSVAPALTENFFDSHARVIPVAEIELGGSYQVSQHINASVGYLFQAWWDLGAFEQIPGNVFLNPMDDSNIMSFDGLFARVEVCF